MNPAGRKSACARCLRCLPLLFLMLLAPPVRVQAADQVASDPIYSSANGHWYQVVFALGPISWQDARVAAERQTFLGYRGHLATITSPEENQFVWSQVIGPGAGRYDYWLGGFQDTTAPDFREPGGGWRWVTGEPFAFPNWALGQPNESANSRESVIEYRKGEGEHWNDVSQEARSGPYLVEYEPATAPFPTAIRIGVLPIPVIGGQSTVGQVLLDRPAAPRDLEVTFESSDPTVAVVPPKVTVPSGAESVLFSVVTPTMDRDAADTLGRNLAAADG